MAALAWRLGTLSPAGALAASLIGAVILYGTGWIGGAVLAAFFVSSNLISRVTRGESAPVLDAKGDRRDAWQVLANGGPAALAAIASPDPRLGIWLLTASLAAAGADTWATSVGMRSPVPPRLLWSSRPVPPGTSGGVTLLGAAGATAGAIIIAGVGALASGIALLFPVGTLIGFLGMVADSAIGGALQARRHCPRCEQPSERRFHRCGTRTELRGGIPWLTNDGVNLCATTLAVIAGLAAWNALD